MAEELAILEHFGSYPKESNVKDNVPFRNIASRYAKKCSSFCIVAMETNP